jgi:hypothetical protein
MISWIHSKWHLVMTLTFCYTAFKYGMLYIRHFKHFSLCNAHNDRCYWQNSMRNWDDCCCQVLLQSWVCSLVYGIKRVTEDEGHRFLWSDGTELPKCTASYACTCTEQSCPLSFHRPCKNKQYNDCEQSAKKINKQLSEWSRHLCGSTIQNYEKPYSHIWLLRQCSTKDFPNKK